jgi:wyosine [tRNA(Phe)-imidazoG37] synthetase (radical SAM superfamily)
MRSTTPSAFRHLFGPVPSRRLGRSLGIDLVPAKVCTLDCVYCECGATTCCTTDRRAWVDTGEVLAELERWLGADAPADHLTFSGAGEPTLHVDLGRIATWLAARTTIPLALLTNGTLLDDAALRAEVRPCTVILPSLDAADEVTFQRINRPAPGLTAAALVEALVALRRDFPGQIWLEVLLVDGVNDTAEALAHLSAAVRRIRPDRVQVNTAVRPGTLPGVRPATRDALARALAALGPGAEPVAHFAATPPSAAAPPDPGRVLDVVRRRPETVTALASALGHSRADLQALIDRMVVSGQVRCEPRGGEIYVIAVER